MKVGDRVKVRSPTVEDVSTDRTGCAVFGTIVQTSDEDFDTHVRWDHRKRRIYVYDQCELRIVPTLEQLANQAE